MKIKHGPPHLVAQGQIMFAKVWEGVSQSATLPHHYSIQLTL